MNRYRQVRVTIETHQIRVTRMLDAAAEIRCWCNSCSSEQPFALPERAASAAGISLRQLFRRLEAGEIHFNESPQRTVLICLTSIKSNVEA